MDRRADRDRDPQIDREGTRRKVLLEALEPRVLLSADPLGVVLASELYIDQATAAESSLHEVYETTERVSSPSSLGTAADLVSGWSLEGLDAVPATSAAASTIDPAAQVIAIAMTGNAIVALERTGGSEAALQGPAGPTRDDDHSKESTPTVAAERVTVVQTDHAGVTGASAVLHPVPTSPVSPGLPGDATARGPPPTAASAASSDSATLSLVIVVDPQPLPSSSASGVTPGVSVLTEGQFSLLMDAARERLRDLGDSTDSHLDGLSFRIVDLPGVILARLDGSTLLIDSNAAGFGWFLDASPSDALELGSAAGSPATGRVDLLSVLARVLAFDPSDPTGASGSMGAARWVVTSVGVGQGSGAGSDTHAPVAPSGGIDPDEPPPGPSAGGGPPGSPQNSGSVFAANPSPFQPTAILDLSSETAPLTITLAAGGDVVVAGSASHNGSHSGITSILGGAGSDTLYGPDEATVWTLSGLDAGSVAYLTFAITFTEIEGISGGSARDSFDIQLGGLVTGSLSDGAGTVDVSVAGFVTLTGDFGFTQTTLASVVVTDGSSPETLTNARLLSVGVSAGTVFVGVDGAGFSATIGQFALALIRPASSADTRSWYAVRADLTGGGLAITGFSDFGGTAPSLSVEVNTKESDGTYVDFTQIDADGAGGRKASSRSRGPA